MAGPDEAVTEGEGYAKQRPEGSATAPRAAACGGKRRQRPQRSEPCSPHTCLAQLAGVGGRQQGAQRQQWQQEGGSAGWGRRRAVTAMAAVCREGRFRPTQRVATLALSARRLGHKGAGREGPRESKWSQKPSMGVRGTAYPRAQGMATRKLHGCGARGPWRTACSGRYPLRARQRLGACATRPQEGLAGTGSVRPAELQQPGGSRVVASASWPLVRWHVGWGAGAWMRGAPDDITLQSSHSSDAHVLSHPAEPQLPAGQRDGQPGGRRRTAAVACALLACCRPGVVLVGSGEQSHQVPLFTGLHAGAAARHARSPQLA